MVHAPRQVGGPQLKNSMEINVIQGLQIFFLNWFWDKINFCKTFDFPAEIIELKNFWKLIFGRIHSSTQFISLSDLSTNLFSHKQRWNQGSIDSGFLQCDSSERDFHRRPQRQSRDLSRVVLLGNSQRISRCQNSREVSANELLKIDAFLFRVSKGSAEVRGWLR